MRVVTVCLDFDLRIKNVSYRLKGVAAEGG